MTVWFWFLDERYVSKNRITQHIKYAYDCYHRCYGIKFSTSLFQALVGRGYCSGHIFTRHSSYLMAKFAVPPPPQVTEHLGQDKSAEAYGAVLIVICAWTDQQDIELSITQLLSFTTIQRFQRRSRGLIKHVKLLLHSIKVFFSRAVLISLYARKKKKKKRKNNAEFGSGDYNYWLPS